MQAKADTIEVERESACVLCVNERVVEGVKKRIKRIKTYLGPGCGCCDGFAGRNARAFLCLPVARRLRTSRLSEAVAKAGTGWTKVSRRVARARLSTG
jgi:hypothetical protein